MYYWKALWGGDAIKFTAYSLQFTMKILVDTPTIIFHRRDTWADFYMATLCWNVIFLETWFIKTFSTGHTKSLDVFIFIFYFLFKYIVTQCLLQEFQRTIHCFSIENKTARLHKKESCIKNDYSLEYTAALQQKVGCYHFYWNHLLPIGKLLVESHDKFYIETQRKFQLTVQITTS